MKRPWRGTCLRLGPAGRIHWAVLRGSFQAAAVEDPTAMWVLVLRETVPTVPIQEEEEIAVAGTE